MAEPRHSQPGDSGFLLSLGRQLGGAVALVLIVAAAFWGIGQVRTDRPDPVIHSTVSAPGDGSVAAPSATEQVGEPAAPDPTEPVAAPTEAAEPTAAPTSDATAEPGPEPTDAATVAPDPAPAGDVDPATIRVQILDAVLDDGGASADEVGDRLQAAGYRVIATNKAVRTYERTTVFYTAGNEAAARQIAEQFGFDVVEPKPDNLSDAVEVHLVVGADA